MADTDATNVDAAPVDELEERRRDARHKASLDRPLYDAAAMLADIEGLLRRPGWKCRVAFFDDDAGRPQVGIRGKRVDGSSDFYFESAHAEAPAGLDVIKLPFYACVGSAVRIAHRKIDAIEGRDGEC